MAANSNSRRNSILTASAIAVALTVWVLSGAVNGKPESTGPAPAVSTMDEPVSVRVRVSRAESVLRTISASARTEPDRMIELKSETEGRVVTIGAERGAAVSRNQVLVEIDMRDRQARLTEIDALIRQRELEFEAGMRLRDENFISPSEFAAREAALESARASREHILLDIAHTQIAAPFDAIVYDRLVEIGDYLGTGDPVAQLIDLDPLIVVADINERDITAVKTGASGKAILLDGSEVEGQIRYIAPAADESTRSYRVELAIPNPGFTYRVGASARLELGGDTVLAHALSPSSLWLADDGTIGVKIVDDSDRARFVPIEIVDTTAESMLVTGLPPTARVITVGQGYVVDGQAVIPEQ
jgi:multidrug efflux system membrane fusion protein